MRGRTLGVALLVAIAGCSPTRAGAAFFYAQGRSQLERGEFEAAVRSLTRAIALNPSLVAAWSDRGLARYKLGRYAEALVDLDSAIQLNHHMAAAYNNRGLVKRVIGRKAEALLDFD